MLEIKLSYLILSYLNNNNLYSLHKNMYIKHESGMFSLKNFTVMFRCQYLNVN